MLVCLGETRKNNLAAASSQALSVIHDWDAV